MGAIEGNQLAGLENPTIHQTRSAIVSSVDSAFLAALVFVVIGLVLVFFIKSGKKTQGIPLDTGGEQRRDPRGHRAARVLPGSEVKHLADNSETSHVSPILCRAGSRIRAHLA